MSKFYVLIDNQRHGPLEKNCIIDYLSQGKITAATYIWYEGLSNWILISDVPEFAAIKAMPVVNEPKVTPEVNMNTSNIKPNQSACWETLEIKDSFIEDRYKNYFYSIPFNKIQALELTKKDNPILLLVAFVCAAISGIIIIFQLKTQDERILVTAIGTFIFLALIIYYIATRSLQLVIIAGHCQISKRIHGRRAKIEAATNFLNEIKKRINEKK